MGGEGKGRKDLRHGISLFFGGMGMDALKSRPTVIFKSRRLCFQIS